MSNPFVIAATLPQYLCRYPLSAGSSLVQSILVLLCNKWGQHAIRKMLDDLYQSFQADPILAGRYGIRNVQILIDQLEIQ